MSSQFNRNGINPMVASLLQLLSQITTVYVNSFALRTNGFQCIPVFRIPTEK